MPLPGSSNQGSLLESPSNPPPQPRPGMPRFPWCPELSQLLGPHTFHTSIQTWGRFPEVIGPDRDLR